MKGNRLVVFIITVFIMTSLIMLVTIISYTIRSYNKYKEKTKHKPKKILSLKGFVIQFIRIIKWIFNYRNIYRLFRNTKFIIRTGIVIIAVSVTRITKIKDLGYVLLTLNIVNLIFVSYIVNLSHIWRYIGIVSGIFGYILIGLMLRYLFLYARNGVALAIIPLILLVVPTWSAPLMLFERIKDQGIPNNTQQYFMFSFLILAVAVLLFVCKIILDKGILWVSVAGGVIFFILLVFLTTTAIGFYVTAISADTMSAEHNAVNFWAYILTYSRIGGIFFFSTPIDEQDTSTHIAQYLVFISGIFFVAVIISFLVSYAVSMIILRNTNESGYQKYIKKTNRFMIGYFQFIERRGRICEVIIWDEIRKYKVMKNYESY